MLEKNTRGRPPPSRARTQLLVGHGEQRKRTAALKHSSVQKYKVIPGGSDATRDTRVVNSIGYNAGHNEVLTGYTSCLKVT